MFYCPLFRTCISLGQHENPTTSCIYTLKEKRAFLSAKFRDIQASNTINTVDIIGLCGRMVVTSASQVDDHSVTKMGNYHNSVSEQVPHIAMFFYL